MKMNFAICVIATIALPPAVIEALPHTVRFQPLIYNPSPTPPPRPMRVRRKLLGGQLASNPNGGSADLMDSVLLSRSSISPTSRFVDNQLSANVFKSENTLPSGFQFERNGTGLGYQRATGHAASIGQSSIPNFGKQVEVGGKYNLWSTPDRNTRLDLTGGASKWTRGPLSGQEDWNTGFGLTHMFGEDNKNV